MSAIRSSRRTSQATPSTAVDFRAADFGDSSTDEQPSLSLGERRAQRRARKAGRYESPDGDRSAAVPREKVRKSTFSWRIVSAMLVFGLGVILFLLFTQNLFFVHSIFVSYTDPEQFLTPPQLFGRSGLDSMNLFWINADSVKQKLEQDPQIASASVQVGWPNVVQVTVTERQPALIWTQSGQKVWVDVTGHVMAIRRDVPTLVQVTVQNAGKGNSLGPCLWQGMDHTLGAGDCIDANTVNGVLQFTAMYPNVTALVYDPAKGLGFHEGGNWMLWFGDGKDMSTKMAVYNAIIAYLQSNNIQPTEINVANPDAPYYNAASSS